MDTNDWCIIVYLSLSVYLSTCLSACPKQSTFWYRLRPKRPRAESTHLLRQKRPTPKLGRNDPGRNDPGRNDPGPKRPGFTHLQYYVYKSNNKHRLCFMNFHHTEYKDILSHKNGGTKSSVGRASQGGRFDLHPGCGVVFLSKALSFSKYYHTPSRTF